MNYSECGSCGGQGYIYTRPIKDGGQPQTCGSCGGSGQR